MSRLNQLSWKDDEINEYSMHDKQDKFRIYDVRELKSSALGQNELKYIQTYGRIQIDLMKQIMRDHQLESYKLDYVSHYFFGGNKVDLDAQKMFDIYLKGSKSRGQIAIYCVKDCILCNQLIQNQDIINKETAMANVCSVPLSYIFHRGQGIKIFSLILKQTTLQGYLIKDHGKQRNLAKKEKKQKKNRIQELLNQEDQLDQHDLQIIQDGDLDYDEDGKYQGATVLDPKTGIYNNEMISVFDYASLYPSSMIDYNISHDTLLYNPDLDNLDSNLEYSDPIIVDCEKITIKSVVRGNKIEQEEHKETEKQTYVFVKNTKKQGIIPQILQHLLKQRKHIREIIKYETDEVKKKILDGQQLAYKITANSLYGQCGAKTSQIYLPQLAKATTAVGRLMLKKAINFAQNNYNAKVIYGDSVTYDTPLLIKYPDGLIDIKTIDDLSDKWQPYEQFKPDVQGLTDKQQSFIDAQIWTNGQWSQIRRVIRHKTNKRIFRVNTFEGCVDVTEDHSLIDINGNEIKPTDVKVGETKLLHSFPNEFPEYDMKIEEQICDKFKLLDIDTGTSKECINCHKDQDLSNYYANNTAKGGYANTCKICVKEKRCKRENKPFNSILQPQILNYNVQSYSITKFEAWVWGFFYADGSGGSYKYKSGTKYSWAINNSNLQFLEKARQYLLKIEPKHIVKDFKVLDTMESSDAYKLVPVGSLKYIVEKYRKLLYDKEDYKKVPQIILNSSYEIRSWFMKGYLTGDGTKGEKHTINNKVGIGINSGKWNFANTGKIGAQGLYYLMKSLNWTNIRICTRENKDNVYFISTLTDLYTQKNQNKIMNKFEITNQDQNNFVYDIETDVGLFQASVGSIVCSNTDSCFLVISEEYYLNKNQEYTLQEKIQLLFNQGYKIQNEYQKTISVYQKLEFEKVLFPLILFAKKRYYGYCYESPNKKKLISPGTISKRRDSAQIAKIMFENTIDILMLRQINLEQDYFLQSIRNIQEEMIRIITKEYNKDYFKLYRNYNGGNYKTNNLPHVQVVKRMQDQGEKVEANERIEFYYAKIDNENKGKKQYEKSVSSTELDQIIEQNKGDIDYMNYIEKQIMNPLISIYALDVNKLIQSLAKNPQTLTQLYNMTIDKIKQEKQEKYKDKTDVEIQQKVDERIKIFNQEIVQLLIFNTILPDLKMPGLSEFKNILKQQKNLPNILQNKNTFQQYILK